jgi:hypothetical protein
MRRYRKSTGKTSMRDSTRRPQPSLIQMQNAGTAMGMMAASGVRRGSLVQRAQLQNGAQRPTFTSGQAQNAGIAMGMMAMSGQRNGGGFLGRVRSSFDSLKDMALAGDTGSKEFDDIR